MEEPGSPGAKAWELADRQRKDGGAMTQYESEAPVSGWAIGGVTFAAALLIIIGVFEAIEGISAIAKDSIFVKTPNYVFDLDTTAYGWIHLILGVLLFCTGLALWRRASWAAI